MGYSEYGKNSRYRTSGYSKSAGTGPLRSQYCGYRTSGVHSTAGTGPPGTRYWRYRTWGTKYCWYRTSELKVLQMKYLGYRVLEVQDLGTLT